MKLHKKLEFFKLHGNGNDFIIIDLEKNYWIDNENFNFFKKLCNRNFGIGSDGVILIKKDNNSDFYMKYYNSDGKEGTMCGNGGRCAIFFFYYIKKKKKYIYFKAIDGYHKGLINYDKTVSIYMIPVYKDKIIEHSKYIFLYTGSPHYVIFVKNLHYINVIKTGREIRYNNIYDTKKGINVNFVQIFNNTTLQVRTYERGVENETLSCGTGAIASVIAAFNVKKINNKNKEILVKTLGGNLWVTFKESIKTYKNIYLTGSVNIVFKGSLIEN